MIDHPIKLRSCETAGTVAGGVQQHDSKVISGLMAGKEGTRIRSHNFPRENKTNADSNVYSLLLIASYWVA